MLATKDLRMIYDDGTRYDKVKRYFDTLNKENIIFEDGDSLFEACKKMVTDELGSEEDDRYVYYENVKDLAALSTDLQSWHVPVERNDVSLKK